MRTFLFGAAIFLLAATGHAASDRLALIIGNDIYENFGEREQLANAVNDARSIKESLESKGFKVTLLINANRIETLRVLNSFQRSLSADTTALLFYSGHGVEVGGANYLLPSDTPKLAPSEKYLVEAAAISLDDIISRLGQARASVLIVDACRNDPFEEAAQRSKDVRGETAGTLNRGLAPLSEEPSGTFIVYSAGVKQLALDRLGPTDTDPNSVFTRVFLDEIEVPGRSIREVVVGTRGRVRELALTAKPYPHEQFPAYYDQLTDELVLVPKASDPIAEAFRVAIADSKIDDLGVLVRLHPNHPKSEEARRILALRQGQLLNREIDATLKSQDRAALRKLVARAEGHDRISEIEDALKLHEEIDAGVRALDLKILELLYPKLIDHPRREQVRQAIRNALYQELCGKLLSYGFTCQNDLVARVPDGSLVRGELDEERNVEERTYGVNEEPEAEVRAAPAVEEPFAGSREQIRDVQARLTLLGFKPGTTDGLMGRQTRQALLDYRRSRGVTESGKIDGTLFSLLATEIDEQTLSKFFDEQLNSTRAAAERRRSADAERRARQQRAAREKSRRNAASRAERERAEQAEREREAERVKEERRRAQARAASEANKPPERSGTSEEQRRQRQLKQWTCEQNAGNNNGGNGCADEL